MSEHELFSDLLADGDYMLFGCVDFDDRDLDHVIEP